MSPAASAGPPYARPTSINGGGPVSMANGTKASGIDIMKGSNRVFPHLDDLVSVTPDIDIHSPIRKILQDGELLARQADTHLDFRRPDVALQEYIKASIVAVEIIPRHKDYPSLQADRGDLHRLYAGLKKRINAQHEKFEEVKDLIKENNIRSGMKPGQQNSLPNVDSGRNVTHHGAGHDRAQSVQNLLSNGNSTAHSNVNRAGEYGNGIPKAVSAPSNSSNAPARKKPPVQPKPEGLHGNAIQPSSGAVPTSAPVDLAARFARLRGVDPAVPVQDPRIRTRPISIPDLPESTPKSPTTPTTLQQPGRNVTVIRPSGPREMPSAPTTPLRSLKTSMNVQIPGMPRPPDAIYSPAGNVDTAATANLPSSIPRNSSYVSSGRKPSTSSGSKIGRTPVGVDSRQDYFSPPQSLDSYVAAPNVRKREDPVPPNSTTVSADNLMEYLGMGSHALRILLVDIRSRDEFDAGHIMSQSIVCIEPITLRRGMSADDIGESIVLSPDSEQKLYEQRHEFDLIIYYDQSSSAVNLSSSASTDTALQDFSIAIYDYAYAKKPKRRPLLLVGGLDAWVDLMGSGALQSSTTGTVSSHVSSGSGIKPARPLGRVTMARDQRRVPPARRKTYESRPLSKEEESKWDETLREDSTIDSPTASPNNTADEMFYARTTEDFFRRYPELPAIQESMISPPPPPPTKHYHDELVPSMPRPPARPPPALPRQRSSGVSEKTANATYAMSADYTMVTSSESKMQTITTPQTCPGLTGLENPGVLCYMNAAVQCLSATPAIRDYLIGYRYPPSVRPPRKAQETSDPPQLMVRNFGNLLGHLWSGHYDWVTPRTFQRYMNAVHAAKLRQGQDKSEAYGGSRLQHDSSEFLDYLLEIMLDELNLNRDQIDYIDAEAALSDTQKNARNVQPILVAAHTEWQRFLFGENSYISQQLRGQVLNTTTCFRCNLPSRRWQPFTILTLNIEDVNSQTIQSALKQQYNNPTKDVVDDYQCGYCKAEHRARREECISYLPNYLIIQIARFGRGEVKLTTNITFPERGLDMTPSFLPNPGNGAGLDLQPGHKGPFLYDCFAVVQHAGGDVRSGHYWAISRSFDRDTAAGTWHRFNDKRVEKSSFQATQTRNTSIIFYRRQGT